MHAVKSNIPEWSHKIASLLPSKFGLVVDDLKQEIALFICERSDMSKACSEGHFAYVVASVRNYFIDSGTNASVVETPRMRSGDSDLTKSMKLALMNSQVSMNDEVDGYDYETILPCGKYEQIDLWRKVRNEKILYWIGENAPLLDFLLEVDKSEAIAPAVWNSKPLVRAFIGTEEVKKMLQNFGYGLTSDERLHIEESMFRKFLHAKNAKTVSTNRTDDAPKNFFMAM